MPEHGFHCQIVVVYRRGREEPAEHPLIAAARAQGTPIFQLDGHTRRLPDSIRWLRHKVESEGFSILHCHDYKANLMSAWAAGKIAGPRPALVATVRHTELGFQMGLFQVLDSLVLHRFHRLTVPSGGALQELKRWPALRRRTEVIHHAVAKEALLPRAALAGPAAVAGSAALARKVALAGNAALSGDASGRGTPSLASNVSSAEGTSVADRSPLEMPTPASAWPSRNGGPLISIIGRLAPVKGHRVFLESARKVLAARPDAEFWIIGAGDLRDQLEATAQRLGLKSAVSFLGYRADACYAMAISDVVVCASFYESFPRVVLEALVAERPVVATSVGGIPEIVMDGKTGVTVPAADPHRLAEAVLRLINQPKLARRLATAGRNLVAEHYTLDAQALALANLYREAIQCA
jgi:glycosyltransferase involved in cell wall biosynthesis